MLYTILMFIAVLLVLVIAHEAGHFFVAKFFGVKVEEFGFGLPPRITAWRRRGTEYSLNWLPLGGFVRLKGEGGENEDDADSFSHKPVWQRLCILLAGVFMNFALAYIFFTGIAWSGHLAVAPEGDTRAIITNERAVIADVFKETPAAVAGIQAGDEIISVAGVPITRAKEVRPRFETNKQAKVEIVVKRANEEKTFLITPAEVAPGIIGIGVHVFTVAHVRYPLQFAFVRAASDTWFSGRMIFDALTSVIGQMVRGNGIPDGVAGPVGIAIVTGQVARTGFIPLIGFMALLSVNLGLLNVLPFPALDGGRALFVILEKVLRRRVRAEIERVAHILGFSLLMILVIAVTYNDIKSIW